MDPFSVPIANAPERGYSDTPAPIDLSHTHAVEVVESYFDAVGRPIKRKSLGAARVARSYDKHGNQVEEAYFGADGKPTTRKDLGAARIHWRYDDAGRKIEAEFFDADGALLARDKPDTRRVPALEKA